jgi:hypothetical protein
MSLGIGDRRPDAVVEWMDAHSLGIMATFVAALGIAVSAITAATF